MNIFEYINTKDQSFIKNRIAQVGDCIRNRKKTKSNNARTYRAQFNQTG